MLYPAGNPGVYPVDTATSVGMMRYIIGDTESVPYDPVEPGFQNYALFSDAELEALLFLSEDSISRGVGYAYLKIAGMAASEAVDWSTDDLRLSLSKKPAELRAIAQMWFDRAEDEDLISGSQEYFDLVPIRLGSHRPDELAEWPWPFGDWQ